MINDVAKILKRLNIITCVIILILSYEFVFTRLLRQEGIKDVVSFFENFNVFEKIPYLLVLVVLMFVNWSIEANKWRYALWNEYKLSFSKAIQSTFLGVCVSFIFPNRVGDFLGRGFALPQGYALKGAAATVVGNISQLIVTVIMGIVGGGYMLLFHYYQAMNPIVLILGLLLIGLMLILFLYLYFNVAKIYNLCKKIGWLQQTNWVEKLCFFQNYTPMELLNILLFSLGRYIVFVVQMFLAFCCFDVSMPVLPFVMMTCVYFFLTSLIPTWVLSELGVRASVALLLYVNSSVILSASGVNEVSIVAATTFLWMLNVVVPALIGSCFVFSLRVFRTKSIK